MSDPDHRTTKGARPRALITGGARRVGRAIALALAQAGCDVDVTYRSSDTEAHALLDRLRSLGSRDPRAYRLDLDDTRSTRSLADAYLADRTTLEVLVHNASAYLPTPMLDREQPNTAHPTPTPTPTAFDADAAAMLMRIHAIGPLALTHALLPLMLRSPGASIVAMCDIHAMGRPRAGYAAYSMSKAAMHEMVRSLAAELAPTGIRVNGVAPGVVQWPESGPDSDESMQRRYISRVPMARAGTPEEAAEAVVFLALHAGYTTGQVLRVDGGRWLGA
ncbi:MAG: SDR family oxidoreductase [Phycisphaerales bacterium]